MTPLNYQIESAPIEPGSYELRIWLPGDDVDTAPIDTVMNLKNTGYGQCLMSMAHGDLTNDMNIQIGLVAMELGFNWLEFYVAHGEKVTRHAKYLYSDKKFDWYGVDLYGVKRELEI